MRYFSRRLIFIFLIISSYGMEGGESSVQNVVKKNIAISFDLDDVLTGALLLEFDGLASLSADVYRERITENRHRYPLLQKLYSDDESLVERQIANPIATSEGVFVVYPVMALIETIKQLESKGYLIVGATNQLCGSHQKYRKILREHYGINLNDFFRAVLTTLPHRSSDLLAYCANNEDNIHTVYDEKPLAGYFNALKNVVMQLDHTITTVIHIDDRPNNVRGAGRVDSIVGIHFDVPGGCVLAAQPEQLESAITNLKNQLKLHGVEVE